MFTIAVNHECNTILYPHSDHLSFFSVTASLFLCYSFFLFSDHGTKSHTVVIIIFYATNDFSFFFFLLNFRIISKSILHNHSNSILKLNYDRRKWENTFLFFFFSSCLFFFFSWSWVVLLHFLLFFSRLFLLSFWGCAVPLLFSVLDIFFFFFLGGAEFVLVFGLSSLFLIFWGPCVFSFSLLRSPEQATPK